MANRAGRFRAALEAIVHFRSLKTRLIFFTLVMFLISILSLAFYANWILHRHMEQLLGEQQFSTVSFIAAEVNAEFRTRAEALTLLAEKISPAMMRNPSALQAMLEDRPIYYSLFNNGIAIADLSGTVIADFPRLPGRLGANFRERDYVIGPLKEGKVTFGRPVMSKLMHAPAFVIGVPVRDARGTVIGVIGGVTDLRLPNFLDKVTENRYGKTGGYFLVIPKERLIVTATDRSRIMTTLPAAGINPTLDRFLQGYEGSAVYVNPLGVEVLGSAKGIPVSGWLIGAILPTKEAYIPIHRMLLRGQLAAVFITLLLGGLLWWMLKRQLAPMFDTVKTVANLSDTKTPLAVVRQDEIGELIGGFNRLLQTLRKQEEAVMQSEEKHRRMIATISDVIAIIAKDGTIKYKSPNITRWFGWQPEDLIGTDGWNTVHPQDRERIQKAFVALLERDNASATVEYRYKCKDQTYKPIELTAVNLTSDPIIDGVLTNYRDITERRKADEENQILTERLQRSEKMEALGQLAGGVAHDLNNVLGILTGYSELLLEDIPEGHRSRGHVEKILQSTEKGAAIIEDLLTMARRGVVATDVINLNTVVSGFLKSPAFERIKDHHPRLSFRAECEENLLNIKGSRIHLEKTLMNLVSNAAESITGEGEVTIRTENRYLDAPIRGYDEVKQGDYVVLTVSDTGMGIPGEYRQKIFEPFYTKKTMGRSGTGLGLAIVWGTVKDHNGYIDLQTELGKGTTLTLYFSATREEPAIPQPKARMEQYMGRGESVLVVDDIAEQREIATRLLTRLGYDGHAVSGGEEAVEYLREHRVDILVLDMIMAPGIDGLETYQRVLEINPKQKAILVSGFSETDRVTEALRLGAGAYVKKPYVMEKIGLALRDELART